MPDPEAVPLFIALVGALILVALLSGAGIRFVRARRTADELAREDEMFDAYLREIGWNPTGEAVE